MEIFNDVFGTTYSFDGRTYTAIIERVREPRDLTDEQLHAAMVAELDHPWWDKPHPPMFFGNTTQFERLLQASTPRPAARSATTQRRVDWLTGGQPQPTGAT